MERGDAGLTETEVSRLVFSLRWKLVVYTQHGREGFLSTAGAGAGAPTKSVKSDNFAN